MFEKFKNSNDTDPAVQQYLDKRLAEMSPGEKLIKCFELCSSIRLLMISGIQMRYPNASEQEIRKRFAAITLGRDFTDKHLNWDPDREGY